MTAVMSTTPKSVYNVPNALTSARFALAIGVMALIPLGSYRWALVLFTIAATTDWMDGYWARKYGQVTKLGRIFDPFVDKIIICGTFIALVEVDTSGVASWMATIVVARELLVTSLRGMIEGSGGDFSARPWGKWKMVLQCAAVIAILLYLIQPRYGVVVDGQPVAALGSHRADGLLRLRLLGYRGSRDARFPDRQLVTAVDGGRDSDCDQCVADHRGRSQRRDVDRVDSQSHLAARS